LTGDNLVRFLPKPARRGTILDRAGRPLTVDAFAMEVGVVPGKLQDKENTVAYLANALQMKPETVREKLDAPSQPDWFVPIKQLPYNTSVKLREQLESVPGIVVHDQSVRTYPQGTVGAHLIGYMTELQGDELKEFAAKGYHEGDRVGRAGLEGSEESVLRGTVGGTLNIITREGVVVRELANKPQQDGADLVLTIDSELQKRAEAN